VFRYCIQSSVERFCDVQKSGWTIRELCNDCSPSWVRNRGQYVCQLIHSKIHYTIRCNVLPKNFWTFFGGAAERGRVGI
jgi:hypothetical protein